VSREHLPCFESSLAVFATALLYGIDGYGCSVQNGTAGVSFLLALKKRWSWPRYHTVTLRHSFPFHLGPVAIGVDLSLLILFDDELDYFRSPTVRPAAYRVTPSFVSGW